MKERHRRGRQRPGREPERGPALRGKGRADSFQGITSSCVFMVTLSILLPEPCADLLRAGTGTASTLCTRSAPTAEMAVDPAVDQENLPRRRTPEIVRREGKLPASRFPTDRAIRLLDCWCGGCLNRLACSSPGTRPEHRRVVGPGLRVFTRIPRPRIPALRIRARWTTAACRSRRSRLSATFARANRRIDDDRRALA